MTAATDKPLLLIFPFGYLSHYLRCLVLAGQLRPYFRIMFAAHPAYDGFVEDEGFASFPCKRFDEAEVLVRLKKFDFSWLDERKMEAVFLSQVAAMEQLAPVAVLGDACPTLKMAAQKAGLPFISLFNGYMSRYYALVRSLSRTHPVYPYISFVPPYVQAKLTARGEAIKFRQIHQPFRRIRSRYGLPPQTNYLEELEGDENLICDLPSLFPQKALPAHYHTIPPLIYEGKTTASDAHRRLAPGKKTIYISMGSTGDWAGLRFLNDDYFRKYNIVAAGDKDNMLCAPGIIKAGFVPARSLLPHTDLVICHGGNGTIYQALAYGLPLLCKTAHFEQEWNLQALVRHGLGQSLDEISSMQDLKAEIAYWTERKGAAPLKQVRQEIRESRAAAAKTLQRFCAAVLAERGMMTA